MIDSKNSPPAERDAQLVQAHRDELVERMARAIREDGTVDPLPGMRLYRVSSPTTPLPALFEPAFCVIAQGSKELYLGEESFRYDPYHYCVGTVELAIVSQITDASKERPYLGLRVELDPILVGSVMVETGDYPSENNPDARAISVDSLDADLMDAVVRLVRLLDAPYGSWLPCATDHAGNCLPSPAGKARRPAPSHCSAEWLHFPHCQSD